MKTKQLSIFLENKSGRLTEVTEALGAAGINLSAMSIADNSDFGILRCIVSDPDKAYQMIEAARALLKENGWIVPSKGYDLDSDRPTHVGRGLYVQFLEIEE